MRAGKRKMRVEKDYDYSIPTAGKKILRKKALIPEPVSERVVRTVRSQDLSVWRHRLLPGSTKVYIVFGVMFVVALIVEVIMK